MDYNKYLKLKSQLGGAANPQKKYVEVNEFPLLGNIGKKDFELDPRMVKGVCKEGNIDTWKCGYQWPKFPCYNKELLACQSTEGVIYFDPVDDMLYILGESYIKLSKLAFRLLGSIESDEARLKATEEKLLYFFRKNGHALFLPGSGIVHDMSQARKTIKVTESRYKPTVENAIDLAAERAGVPLQPRIIARSIYKPEKYPKKVETGVYGQTGGGEIIVSQKFLNPNKKEVVSIFNKKGQHILNE